MSAVEERHAIFLCLSRLTPPTAAEAENLGHIYTVSCKLLHTHSGGHQPLPDTFSISFRILGDEISHYLKGYVTWVSQ